MCEHECVHVCGVPGSSRLLLLIQTFLATRLLRCTSCSLQKVAKAVECFLYECEQCQLSMSD